MCLNLLIGAGSITVIGRLLRDVQNASEAAYIGFAEAKALLLVLRSSHHLTPDRGIWSRTR